METFGFDQMSAMDLLKDYLDITVFGVLGLMSFLMIAYAIERTIYYLRVDLDMFSDRHDLEVALTRQLEDVAFRHFVGVIDLLKAHGLHEVSIVTRRQGT